MRDDICRPLSRPELRALLPAAARRRLLAGATWESQSWWQTWLETLRRFWRSARVKVRVGAVR